MVVASGRRIFVSIACYRDPECPHTIRDLFQRASDPDRVFVGVLWQCDPVQDAQCFAIQTRPGQVRQRVVHPSEAKGPCWARSLLEESWQGEEYVLQIDSHMRFRQGWDERCLDMLAQCPSDNPVLTTYPPPYYLPNRLSNDPRPRVLRARRFHDDQILRIRSATLKGAFKTPIRSAFCAGGFSFTSSDALQQVPHDPRLEYLFYGEEINRTVRLWTHGFDFFAPHEHVVWHLWSRAHRPLFWENQPRASSLLNSQRRLRYLLGTETTGVPEECLIDLEKYGLGTKRTLAEYERFSGVDFVARLVTESAVYGGFPPTFVETID